MNRLLLILFPLAMVGFACGGQGPAIQSGPFPRQAGPGEQMGHCPICGVGSVEGSYCPKDQAIAVTQDKMVRDEACGKDVKAGTFCAKCNAFMFDEQVEHKGKMVRKGTYLPESGSYAGLRNVAYCTGCSAPHEQAVNTIHPRGCDRRGIY